MKRRIRLGLIAVAGVALLSIVLLTACGGGAAAPTEEAAAPSEGEEEMGEGEMAEGEMEHSMDHLMVPEDAAAMENPIEATDESVSAGADLFSTNCVPCHGEGGEGDGPSAAALNPPPANLTQGDAASRTDGELFYIISNGIEGTAMPAWEGQLSEEERWNVINFVRTLQ